MPTKKYLGELLDEFWEPPFDNTLIVIMGEILIKYGDVEITSGYRPEDTDGVHGQVPVRGMDIRSKIYRDPDAVCAWVNSRWQYDPLRPDKKCAIYHNVGRGWHIHLQSHPRTTFTS